MNNHFHLLLLARLANLSPAMAFFMRETSRELARASHRINMTYGGRFFRSNIKTQHYFLTAYKYVYRNAAQAGLVTSVEDYPWSTLRGLLGLDHLLIPVEEDTTLFSDPVGTLNWLNTGVKIEDWNSVGRALKRHEFQLPKDPVSRKPNRLELVLI